MKKLTLSIALLTIVAIAQNTFAGRGSYSELAERVARLEENDRRHHGETIEMADPASNMMLAAADMGDSQGKKPHKKSKSTRTKRSHRRKAAEEGMTEGRSY